MNTEDIKSTLMQYALCNRPCDTRTCNSHLFIDAEHCTNGASIIYTKGLELTQDICPIHKNDENILSFFEIESNHEVCTIDKLLHILSKCENIQPLYEESKEVDEDCKECNGTGEVEYEYQDKNGNMHYHTFDCPICNGCGSSSEPFHYSKYSTVIGESEINLSYVDLFAHLMQQAGDIECTINVSKKNIDKTYQPLVFDSAHFAMVILPLSSGCFSEYTEIKWEE